MPEIWIKGHLCSRCGHVWISLKKKSGHIWVSLKEILKGKIPKDEKPKDEKPKVCPECKSPYWDTERQVRD